MNDPFAKKNLKFTRLPQVEDCETLLSEPQDSERHTKPPRCIIHRYSIVLLLALCFFITALVGAGLGSRYIPKPSSFCAQYVSQYSPVLRDVPISYNIVRFNGSLLKENVFRQSAGPDVDAAWTSLGVDYRSMVVPADQAERSGLQPDQVKISDKYGGGFPANVEGLHHLHCLNLLRQALYYNFDHYHSLGEGAFKNSDEILRFHVSHCLDIIRQQLMCSVDVGVLGQVWWNTERPQAYVDFNTRHKCRNFDAVRQWAEKHQMPETVPQDFLQPPVDGDTIYETIP